MREKPLLTTPQVASQLGKSKRTIHRLVDSGQLVPAVTYPGPSGAYLFAEDEVERFSAAETAATAGETAALRDTA